MVNKKICNGDNFDYYTFFIKNNLLTCKIYKRKNIKNIYEFSYDEDNNVVVFINPKYTIEFIEKNYDYFTFELLNHFKVSEKLKNGIYFNAHVNSFTIFGKKYFVSNVVDKKNYYEIILGKIYLHLTDMSKRYKLLKSVIIDIAKNFVEQRCKYWAKIMNSRCDHILFNDMIYAFAYYRYANHSITFSIFSLSFDINSFDKLIIHELTHYFHQNHKKRFWETYRKFVKLVN